MSNYRIPEPLLITVKHHGKTFTAELPWDSSLDDVFETITGLLVLDGWSESSVHDHIIEYGQELEEYKNYSKNKDEDSPLP
jgi:hypothetical protein